MGQAVKGHRIGAWHAKLKWLRFCWLCGLIALSNDATKKALNSPCRGEED
jgi:hypothetical protein